MIEINKKYRIVSGEEQNNPRGLVISALDSSHILENYECPHVLLHMYFDKEILGSFLHMNVNKKDCKLLSHFFAELADQL